MSTVFLKCYGIENIKKFNLMKFELDMWYNK